VRTVPAAASVRSIPSTLPAQRQAPHPQTVKCPL
jgi:hypothetical protein